MSQRLRVKNLREGRILAALNVCETDERIPQWANGFQERALVRGRWFGTTQLMRLCLTDSCCVILPREVAVIEAANLDHHPLGMGNAWYQFIKPHSECSSSRSSSGSPCSGPQLACACCGCSQRVMEDKGTVASFATTTGTNQKIRAYPGNAVDVGKKIIFQGYDKNGNWVRTVSGGVVIDGESVTLALPFATTTTIWNPGAPTAVIKDPTSYRVLVYSVDATSGEESAIADYQPSETEPMYRMVQIEGCNDTCGGTGTKTLLAIVSLQHIPATVDNDWLLFTNREAYKFGMMAEKYYEEGNMLLGDAYFFGRDRNARNARGVLRHTYGEGAIPLLEAELRKQTGDQSVVDMKFNTLNLAGFV